MEARCTGAPFIHFSNAATSDIGPSVRSECPLVSRENCLRSGRYRTYRIVVMQRTRSPSNTAGVASAGPENDKPKWLTLRRTAAPPSFLGDTPRFVKGCNPDRAGAQETGLPTRRFACQGHGRSPARRSGLGWARGHEAWRPRRRTCRASRPQFAPRPGSPHRGTACPERPARPRASPPRAPGRQDRYPVTKTTGVSCRVAARFRCRSSPRQVESRRRAGGV
jgi:hypothetical protein